MINIKIHIIDDIVPNLPSMLNISIVNGMYTIDRNTISANFSDRESNHLFVLIIKLFIV